MLFVSSMIFFTSWIVLSTIADICAKSIPLFCKLVIVFWIVRFASFSLALASISFALASISLALASSFFRDHKSRREVVSVPPRGGPRFLLGLVQD